MSPTLPGYSLIWSDEFNGAAGSLPDESKWEIVTSGPNLGNNEKQQYIRDPWVVSIDGESMLHIKPQHTDKWYSARLQGWRSFSCPDGKKLRIQAELRNGTANEANQSGIWPAFWTLGQDFRNDRVKWPACGEIDIFENSHGHNWVISTVHYGNVGDTHSIAKPTNRGKHEFTKDAFNTWAIEIDRVPSNPVDETIVWYKNGVEYQRVRGGDFESFDFWQRVAYNAVFPLLNVAVGGNFPETGDPLTPGTGLWTETGLKSGLQVKYVAFYLSS